MNAKETLKEIRTMLGFSDEETKVEMATATLTDGTVIEYEGELAVGTAIFVQTAEGNIPAPDATHEVVHGLFPLDVTVFVNALNVVHAASFCALAGASAGLKTGGNQVCGFCFF